MEKCCLGKGSGNAESMLVYMSGYLLLFLKMSGKADKKRLIISLFGKAEQPKYGIAAEKRLILNPFSEDEKKKVN